MTYFSAPRTNLGVNARWQFSPLAIAELVNENRLSEFIVSEGSEPLPIEALHPLPPLSDAEFYPLQLIALGNPYAVDNCRLRLHKLGYAVRAAFPKEAPNEWSIPLPIIRSTEVVRAARPGDIMRILTKRIAKPQ
ncbi:MAG: hypothetical protein WBA10_19045 [Elainellaceae cyanobacterium]